MNDPGTRDECSIIKQYIRLLTIFHSRMLLPFFPFNETTGPGEAQRVLKKTTIKAIWLEYWDEYDS